MPPWFCDVNIPGIYEQGARWRPALFYPELSRRETMVACATRYDGLSIPRYAATLYAVLYAVSKSQQ